jgi:hypothetical protein
MLGHTVQSSKRQAPVISLRGRSKIGSFHEDLQKVRLCLVNKNQDFSLLCYVVIIIQKENRDFYFYNYIGWVITIRRGGERAQYLQKALNNLWLKSVCAHLRPSFAGIGDKLL